MGENVPIVSPEGAAVSPGGSPAGSPCLADQGLLQEVANTVGQIIFDKLNTEDKFDLSVS